MERKFHLHHIEQLFASHSIVAILGPRQCGKTTLARQFSALQQGIPLHNFDLEDAADVAVLENPQIALGSLEGFIVIDEIQRIPELFTQLRVLIDRESSKQKYLILGSASRDLIAQSSETLAGRIAFMELTPFDFHEVRDLKQLWQRGGFPRSYLAANDDVSSEWREHYVTTYLERDIPNLGIRIPPQNLRRFWMMIAHYHANIFNASELGRSLGHSDTTLRHYLDILTETFMIRQLQPWFENIAKRQVKASKIYFRDSGILHTLLQIHSPEALMRFPYLGASWEGFALEEVIRAHQAKPHECFFWATHGGAELDLLITQHLKRVGFEFKYSDTPTVTKSMHTALVDLKLDHLYVIYPGTKHFRLQEKVTAIGLLTYLSSRWGRDNGETSSRDR